MKTSKNRGTYYSPFTNIMKDKNILISMGIIIYIVMSGIDRFVYHIPNIMYIPVAILGIALILIGFFKDKSK